MKKYDTYKNKIVPKIFQVLASYSPYFHQLFFGPFKEAATGRYVITEPKFNSFATLISLLDPNILNREKINRKNGITFLFT